MSTNQTNVSQEIARRADDNLVPSQLRTAQYSARLVQTSEFDSPMTALQVIIQPEGVLGFWIIDAMPAGDSIRAEITGCSPQRGCFNVMDGGFTLDMLYPRNLEESLKSMIFTVLVNIGERMTNEALLAEPMPVNLSYLVAASVPYADEVDIVADEDYAPNGGLIFEW